MKTICPRFIWRGWDNDVAATPQCQLDAEHRERSVALGLVRRPCVMLYAGLLAKCLSMLILLSGVVWESMAPKCRPDDFDDFVSPVVASCSTQCYEQL